MQRFLTLTLVGVEAVVSSWRVGTSVRRVYKYWVSGAASSFDIFVQVRDFDLVSETVTSVVEPTLLYDDFRDDVAACLWMSGLAHKKIYELTSMFSWQGETVLVAGVEGQQ